MARFDSTREKTKAAKRLRREATPAERALWRRLKQRQLDHLKFRRQHPLGPYVLDFYCPELKLYVELDGGQHGFDNQRAHDNVRTAYLEGKGVRVVRFWNHEVLKDPVNVVDRIFHEAETIEVEQRATQSGIPSPCKGEG